MTAQEARSISESKRKVNIDEALSSINAACHSGATGTWHYKMLTAEQKQELTNLGYKLSEESNYRNEYLIKISW